MTGVVRVATSGHSTPEVVVDVKNVGQQRLGGDLLLLHLLHLLLHHDCLPGDLFPGSRHSQEPGDPLEKYDVDLGRIILIAGEDQL